MPSPIEFYFDFSSPYGYLASTRVEALAARAGRETLWRPILLGAVFKVTGGAPLASLPLKWDYSARDIARFARLWGVPFRQPSRFPIATQAPARVFYSVHDRNPALARRLAAAVYRAYFAEDRDIGSPEVTAQVAASVGLDPAEALAAVNAPEMKERLKRETDTAIARGVFGSPYLIADGEPFWGADRLDQVERWLATGGW
jgi:2-hydroxychromene-2-carboxylate isomerase